MADTEQTLGVVASNKDPGKGGAIEVALPGIGGDKYPEWVEPIMPGCLYFHPHVGDTVEVCTPAGDEITEHSEEVRYRGRLITEGEGYPDEFKENYPDRRGIKTPKGHLVIFDDKTGDVLIKTYKGEHEVSLKGDGSITIKNGKSGDSIELSATGTTTEKATVKHHIKAPLTDLSDVVTDFIIKGTTFNLAVAALHSLWNSELGALKGALTTWGALTPGIPATTDMLIAFATAVKTPVENLIAGLTTYSGAVAGFTSLKVKTG